MDIGATTARAIDYTQLEREVRDERLQDARTRAGDAQRALDELATRLDAPDAANDADYRRRRIRAGLIAHGTIIGVPTVIGAAMGFAGLGRNWSALGLGAAAGAIVGGFGIDLVLGALMSGRTMGEGFVDIVERDHSDPQLEAMRDERERLRGQLGEAQQQTWKYERIRPGESWFGGGRTLGGSALPERATLADIVPGVYAAFDHDGDGSLRIGLTGKSPANEQLRSPAGGPVQNEREVALGIIDRGLSSQRLARWDVDHDEQVTQSEFARGLVTDIAGGGHLYVPLDRYGDGE